eukprot:COSAG05_NODE_5088_length_1266_cov_159.464439_1_plen_413_part_01
MEEKIVPLSGRVDSLSATVRDGLDGVRRESEATMEEKIVPLSERVTALTQNVEQSVHIMEDDFAALRDVGEVGRQALRDQLHAELAVLCQQQEQLSVRVDEDIAAMTDAAAAARQAQKEQLEVQIVAVGSRIENIQQTYDEHVGKIHMEIVESSSSVLKAATDQSEQLAQDLAAGLEQEHVARAAQVLHFESSTEAIERRISAAEASATERAGELAGNLETIRTAVAAAAASTEVQGGKVQQLAHAVTDLESQHIASVQSIQANANATTDRISELHGSLGLSLEEMTTIHNAHLRTAVDQLAKLLDVKVAALQNELELGERVLGKRLADHAVALAGLQNRATHADAVDLVGKISSTIRGMHSQAVNLETSEGLDELRRESQATMEEKIVPLSGRVDSLSATVRDRLDELRRES